MPATVDSSPGGPLFARALGDDWEDLQTAIAERYGVTSEDDEVVVGLGQMDSVTASRLAWPMLAVLARRDAGIPESGADVPFEIRTYPFRDARGLEAVSLRRRFDLDGGPRFFEDALRWDSDQERLVNLLGTDGRLAVELEPSVVDGTLRLEFGEQWVWIGGRYRRLPSALYVHGAVVDSYDDDSERFSVDADVRSQVGPVFGFRGRFDSEREAGPDGLPLSARSVRERPLPGR